MRAQVNSSQWTQAFVGSYTPAAGTNWSFCWQAQWKRQQQQEPQALLCHAEQSHSPDYPGGLILMLYTSTASFIQEWGRQDGGGDSQTTFALLTSILQKKVSLFGDCRYFSHVLHTHSVTELNFWETETVHILYTASPRLLENTINFDFNPPTENVAVNWNQPSIYKK